MVRITSTCAFFQDPAVHEQKLNFLRAHITELNRRILAVMETSDKGFPTHHNRTVGITILHPTPAQFWLQNIPKLNKKKRFISCALYNFCPIQLRYLYMTSESRDSLVHFSWQRKFYGVRRKAWTIGCMGWGLCNILQINFWTIMLFLFFNMTILVNPQRKNDTWKFFFWIQRFSKINVFIRE